MFKLFATVLAITDTASVSVSSIVTDFPNRISCEQAVQRIYTAPSNGPLNIGNGHTVSIKMTAECVAVTPPWPSLN